MTKRVKVIFVCLLVLALALAGCGKPADQPAQTPSATPSTPAPSTPAQPATPAAPAVDQGGTVYLSMYSAPAGVFFSPLYQDYYEALVMALMFDSLLEMDESLGWIPGLAEDWQISSDNLTVTFDLRKDVKWHDGTPFTAKDVAWTIKSMLHPDYTGVRTNNFIRLKGAEAYRAGEADDVAGIQVLGDHRISFSTDEPFAPLLYNIGVWRIMPAHIFGDTPIGELENHPAVKRPVGTGPFKFVEYRPDQFVELVRNDDYWNGAPNIEKVVYRIVNQEVAVGQIETGEIDQGDVNPADMDLVGLFNHVEVHEYADFGYQYMGINHRHPFLSDSRVRKALAHAINRQAIVDQLIYGRGSLMNAPLPPVSWAYDESKIVNYDYNPDKARQLLAEAGFTPGSDGILQKDGTKFEITLTYPTGNQVRIDSASLIQDNLRQVGIRVDLEILEFASLIPKVFEEQAADIWLLGWSLPIEPDPRGVWDTADTGNIWTQATGWHNERAVQLLMQGVEKLDQAERKPIYAEWAGIVSDELPYVFLYTQNKLQAMNTRVQEAAPDVRGVTHNIYEWWIPAAMQ